MSNPRDFEYSWNGCLKKYVGPGGDVVIPDGVKVIGGGAFYGCESLTSITIPEGVTNIGDRAFYGCTSLTSITIPESVTGIGSYAFYGCENLTSATIPEGVTNIGEKAFGCCTGLADSDGNIVVAHILFDYGGSGGDVVIPKDVTSIGNYAFYGCENLTGVMIPDEVTSIGVEAFRGCTGLADADDFIVVAHILFDYDGSGGDVVIPEGVTSIGNKAFECCDSLTSVTIPDSVTGIGDCAFSWCESLTSVTIPEGVTSIGNKAFENCDSLTGVYIPESLTRIGDEVFLDCIELTNVTFRCELSDNSGLSANVFKGCDNLSEITAPLVPLEIWVDEHLGMVAARGFVLHSEEYTDAAIRAEYIKYSMSQRKKLLPLILQTDAVEIIRMLAEAQKITPKNLEQEYLMPAMQCKAEKCIAFLESLAEGWADGKQKTKPVSIAGRELWDGVHYSLDGKTLLKYPQTAGEMKFTVPEGTEVIGKGAFVSPPIEEVILPESVSAIRAGAFVIQGEKTLLVRLSAELKEAPPSAFAGQVCVLTQSKALANTICENKEAYGVYLNGPLDDLSAKAKPHAVKSFLLASEQGVPEIRKWQDSYFAHIRRNEKTYIKQAEKNEYLFRMMLEHGLLSEKGADSLLDTAQYRPERTAALLEYKNTRFGDRKQKDELAYNDPAFARQLKATERREKIKAQKGIKGLAFVSTGALDNFGHIDYYTNAHDLSDLKVYIEKRGGFYRSSVSSKTDYLICNEPNSNSVKSKKAKELGVPVITEEEFLKMANETE